VTEHSFGARIHGAAVAEILTRESNHSPAASFAPLDQLLSRLVHASLEGKRVAHLREAGKKYDVIELHDIDGTDAEYIVQMFDLAAQQARGAWFLPDEAAVRVGWANWPYHVAQHERFASAVAHQEIGKVRFGESSTGLFGWSVLEPLFDVLYRPFALRGPEPLGGDREGQRQTWEDVYRAYRGLGFELDAGLCGMAFGKGWSQLRAPEQLSARRALYTALRRGVP
jgi:hypothetical protein